MKFPWNLGRKHSPPLNISRLLEIYTYFIKLFCVEKACSWWQHTV